MKFASILAAAAFAIVGASAASAQNSVNVVQSNKSGDNNASIKQSGRDNFVGSFQENKRGNNNLDVSQRSGRRGSNAVEAFQDNKRGDNNADIRQRAGRPRS
jgi:hypothetical protein